MNSARVESMQSHVSRLPGAPAVRQFRLCAGQYSMEVIDVGSAIVRLDVPDRDARPANVVLAHGDLAQYGASRREYFGAAVGRVANRIAEGRFPLRGKAIQLSCNDGPHHLHGGVEGFDRRPWRLTTLEAAGDRARIGFALTSPDGDQGYPAALEAQIGYELDGSGAVTLVHEAVSDADTVVNLTNHSYFNLAGEGDVLDHELAIEADRYCEVGGDLIPTGRLLDVAGSPFDFRRPTAIGPRLRSEHAQLSHAAGFDHCFALRDPMDAAATPRLAAVLQHPRTGRRLRVETDRPGLQFYSGNFLDGTACGPKGLTYSRHAGLCLETQAYPDAPNQPGFPSIELAAGRRWRTETVWRFDVLP